MKRAVSECSRMQSPVSYLTLITSAAHLDFPISLC